MPINFPKPLPKVISYSFAVTAILVCALLMSINIDAQSSTQTVTISNQTTAVPFFNGGSNDPGAIQVCISGSSYGPISANESIEIQLAPGTYTSFATSRLNSLFDGTSTPACDLEGVDSFAQYDFSIEAGNSYELNYQGDYSIVDPRLGTSLYNSVPSAGTFQQATTPRLIIDYPDFSTSSTGEVRISDMTRDGIACMQIGSDSYRLTYDITDQYALLDFTLDTYQPVNLQTGDSSQTLSELFGFNGTQITVYFPTVGGDCSIVTSPAAVFTARNTLLNSVRFEADKVYTGINANLVPTPITDNDNEVLVTDPAQQTDNPTPTEVVEGTDSSQTTNNNNSQIESAEQIIQNEMPTRPMGNPILFRSGGEFTVQSMFIVLVTLLTGLASNLYIAFSKE